MEVDMIAAFGFNPKYLYTVSSEQRKEMVRDTQEWIEKYIEGVRANANLYVENATRSGVLKLQRWIQKYFTVRETMPNLSGADATRLARVCYRGRSGVVAAAIPIIIPPSSTSVSDPPRSNMATPLIDLTSILNAIIGLLWILLVSQILRVLQGLSDLMIQIFRLTP
jgi:hypothetical protein